MRKTLELTEAKAFAIEKTASGWRLYKDPDSKRAAEDINKAMAKCKADFERWAAGKQIDVQDEKDVAKLRKKVEDMYDVVEKTLRKWDHVGAWDTPPREEVWQALGYMVAGHYKGGKKRAEKLF